MNLPPGRATDQEGFVRGHGVGEGVRETGTAGEDAAGVEERRSPRPHLLSGWFTEAKHYQYTFSVLVVSSSLYVSHVFVTGVLSSLVFRVVLL